MQQLLALLALAACLADVRGAFKLTLLHTNDMHARFDETNQNTGPCKNTVSHKGCYGGFARLKHAVLEARQRATQQGRSSLFLNAGDNFQGTPYYTLFKWDVTADLLNRLDIDVMSLGNHEFDDGVAGLAPFLQKSKTPIVSANVDTGAETSLQSSNGVLIQKSLKIKLGSTTVCVVGYLTPETKFLANTGKVAISEEVEAIRAEIKRLKQESGADKCHVIIGLGHSGFDVDKHIAAVVPEIDVIVGGHTDTFLYSGKQPDIEKPEANYPYMVTQESGKRVPVVQAYGYTKYLGELELDWDDNWNLVRASGNPVLLDDKVPQDAPVAEEVKKWTAKLSENANQVVGSTTARLEGTTGLCSCAECNLGNLIADAYVEYKSQLCCHETKNSRTKFEKINLNKSKETRQNGTTETPIAIYIGLSCCGFELEFTCICRDSWKDTNGSVKKDPRLNGGTAFHHEQRWKYFNPSERRCFRK